MYAFYKNEVVKALDEGDHERIGYLISDMPYEVLVELRNDGLLPSRRDSDGLESVENSRKRTYKVEQEWMVTYTRVLEYTIDSLGDDRLDKKQVEDMVDVPCFPTEFENGVVVDDIHPRIDIYPIEEDNDRDYDVVEETMKQLQPNQ